MESKAHKELKRAVKRFEKEVLFNEQYGHLDIISVMMDHDKNKNRRAVIIMEEHADKKAVEKQVHNYFQDYHHKIIERQGKPEGTAHLTTGNGIRNTNGGGWGTFGGIFTRASDPSNLYGLSNNHVIAKLNSGVVGDQIAYAPNLNAGSLFNWITLLSPPGINTIDAATFVINPQHSSSWDPVQPISTVGAQVNFQVYKKGYASQTTYGVINSTNGSAQVALNGQIYYFSGIMTVAGYDGHFNQPGDSGSVILTTNGHHMVGLIFAKYHGYCWALPISRIKPLLQ